MKPVRPRAQVRPPIPDPSAGVRAQILATEHWSLLASRSTTQSELLVRISILLTLVSASVVSIALVGQITGFSAVSAWFAVGLLAIVSLVGSLTAVRVVNGSIEDLGYVVGMNRLRAAYAQLDPSVERWFVTSIHDDMAGISATYNPVERSTPTQFLGSSVMFVFVIDSAVFGVLGAALAIALGGLGATVIVVGIAGGAVYLVGALLLAWRRVRHLDRAFVAVSPTPSTAPGEGPVQSAQL